MNTVETELKLIAAILHLSLGIFAFFIIPSTENGKIIKECYCKMRLCPIHEKQLWISEYDNSAKSTAVWLSAQKVFNHCSQMLEMAKVL